mmetsp:Transcript_22486/g.53429  ORF Transcript_22486/g.53429 Transcript_22486/m.53429 type:complete len:213 (-) Transcript_22486:1827-2465(-)
MDALAWEEGASETRATSHPRAAWTSGAHALPLPLLGSDARGDGLVGRHLYFERVARSGFLDALLPQGVRHIRTLLGEGGGTEPAAGGTHALHKFHLRQRLPLHRVGRGDRSWRGVPKGGLAGGQRDCPLGLPLLHDRVPLAGEPPARQAALPRRAHALLDAAAHSAVRVHRDRPGVSPLVRQPLAPYGGAGVGDSSGGFAGRAQLRDNGPEQ